MFAFLLLACLVIISVSILICLYRVVKGPSMPDRIIAVDTIGINIISSVAILAILLETQTFLGIILLIGILAFIGTISFSKFLERGVVIERRRDQ